MPNNSNAQATNIKTTCPYCGVGCGVNIAKESNTKISVKGDEEHPANYGRLCSKGSALAETIDPKGRLTHPMINGEVRSWSETLDHIADHFRHCVDKYGPNSVALYVSGQCLTEDYYAANKFVKGYVGTANIDTNSRLCMASSVVGHKRAFGADTVPGAYEDLEQADLLVLVGSNMAWCHPVLFQRVLKAKQERPNLRIINIDPRGTATSDQSDEFLLLKPGSDVPLFLGLFHYLQEHGFDNQQFITDHTQGYEDTLTAAAVADIDYVSEHTGLSNEQILSFYTQFAETEKVMTLYSQGVNQSTQGTDKVNAILNCHLMTGRIGREGMGPFSLTGQPNAMGGREVGGLANQLACHMDIANPEHRAIVQDFWQSPTVVDEQGLKAVDLFQAVDRGDVKAVWIMATNPVDSMPDADFVRRALKKCPMVVVSDTERFTDTVSCADVLLPACAWGEKDGTVTNSERRISRQRGFLKPPGEAKPDWWAISQVASRMGWADAFNYECSADIFREYAAMSGHKNKGTRDFDISGLKNLTNSDYDALQPVQWPVPEEGVSGGRFFANGGFYTDNKKARILPLSFNKPASNTCDQYPLILNTGRVRDHWHTTTRTGRSPTLSTHISEPFIDINSADAEAFKIEDGQLVEINSQHSTLVVRAVVTNKQVRSSVFMPIHWTEQNASRARTSALVAPNVDRFSGQPELKYTPVNIKPFIAKWHAFIVIREKPTNLSDLFGDGCYWAAAKVVNGWRIDCSGVSEIENWDTFAEQCLAHLPEKDSNHLCKMSTYVDAAQGDRRYALVDDHGLQAALFISANIDNALELSQTWLSQQLAELETSGSQILAGQPPAGQMDVGSIVCSCFQVGSKQIAAVIEDGSAQDVNQVGALLKAGTNCGSCRVDIQGMFSSLSA